MSGEDRNNANGGFGSSSSTMQFKKFVTEDEIVEKRRIRQEEWEKARKADDPLEAPEEEYDPRSLYEKLEEQKQRKQEEFESQFKFGNQVRGLDEEEAKFLDFVSDQQEKIEKCRQAEEAEAIHEYRNAVISQPATSSKSPVIKSRSAPGPSSSKKSQMTLLAGAVKRKNSSTNNEADGKKKKSTATSDEENNPVGPPDSTTEAASASLSAALPCVVTYSDSSDSDSSSSSSDIDTDLLRRAIHIDMIEEQRKAHH